MYNDCEKIKLCEKCGTSYFFESFNGRVVKTLLNKRIDHNNYNVPFYCKECGAISFVWNPIRDLVFIWDLPLPEYYHGTDIAIADTYKHYYKKGQGIILAIGPGYYDKKGKFHETQLKVGDKVVYNADVPWSMRFEGTDEDFHSVVICGEQDVWLEFL